MKMMMKRSTRRAFGPFLAFALLACAATARAEHRLTIVSMNVAGGDCGSHIYLCRTPYRRTLDLKKLSRVIGLHSPEVDALVLQEVHKTQADELARLLHAAHPAVFIHTKQGCDFGDAVIVIAARFHLAEVLQSRRLPRQDQDPNALGRHEYTYLGGVKLKIGDEYLYVYTTHTSGGSQTDEQVADILKMIDSDHPYGAHKVGPVLAGDFNMKPNSTAYQAATRAAFKDTWVEAGLSYARPADEDISTEHACAQFQHIDYVFRGSKSGFRVRNRGAGVIKTEYLRPSDLSALSDHRPVFATMYFD
jgi:endonuclease/exonuclease/phosphatase family metal-dependent hydrolase